MYLIFEAYNSIYISQQVASEEEKKIHIFFVF